MCADRASGVPALADLVALHGAGPPTREGAIKIVKEPAMPADILETQSNVAGEEIRQFIERYERLEAEKKDIADGMKEVMAEAKGRGYDTKVLRKVIALRKRDADDIAEEEAVLEMYKAALGMS